MTKLMDAEGRSVISKDTLNICYGCIAEFLPAEGNSAFFLFLQKHH